MLSEQLLVEIQAGEGQRLAVAARILPSNRQDKPVTLSCLLRWVMYGVRLPDGSRLKLEAARIAGKWVTTPAAIKRFVALQTPSLETAPTPTTPKPTTAKRTRRAERAGRDLEKLGV
jgi:hypothetical protein